MALKNILVPYNGSESSDAAVRAAIQSHKKHGAHVTGLLAHRSAKSRLRSEFWIPQAVMDTLDQVEEKTQADIRAKFFETVGDQIATDKLHWIERFGDADAMVADYARMFDLTIMGRHDSLQGNRRMELHPDLVTLKSGRPVLVVPRANDAADIRKRAVLAWDGHRAATSAVNDAMQILETRQDVTVLSIETGKEARPLKGIDIKTVLERHGINVEYVRVPASKAGVGATMLEFCENHDAGLLVMGAYENSIYKEQIFGGVTQYVLENAQLPVLMSH